MTGTILYIDGVAVPLEPDTDLLGPSVPDVTSTPFLINRGHDFTRYFQGTLDELALYDRNLSETEVREHLAASELLTGVEPGTPAGSGSGFDFRIQPNPFRSGTEIRLYLGEPGPVRLTIHDAAGQRVATLSDDAHDAGEIAFHWDGHDQAGREVAPGVYYVRLQSVRRIESRPLVRLE
jgi:hypothetical protein